MSQQISQYHSIIETWQDMESQLCVIKLMLCVDFVSIGMQTNEQRTNL